MASWPAARLGAVPDHLAADRLAMQVREGVLAEPLGRCDVGAVCRAGGFRLRRAPLRQAGQNKDAVMVPRTDGGFQIAVDPDVWQRAARAETGRRRMRFRIAHEIGHSFFYDRRAEPPRRVLGPSSAEEEFCQRFATSLLVPPAATERAHDPEDIITLAREYDATLTTVAWAIVHACADLEIYYLRYSSPPSGTGPAAMRVLWGAARRFVARNESLKSDLARLAPGEKRRERQPLRLGGYEGLFDLHGYRLAAANDMLLFACRAPAHPEAESASRAPRAQAGGPPERAQLTLGLT